MKYSLVADFDYKSIDHELIMKAIHSPCFNNENIDSVILNEDTLLKEGTYGEPILDVLHEKGINVIFRADKGITENGSMNRIDVDSYNDKVNLYEAGGFKLKSVLYDVLSTPMIIQQQLTYASLGVHYERFRPFIFTEIPIHLSQRGEIEFYLADLMYELIDKTLEIENLNAFYVFNPTIQNGVMSKLLDLEAVSRVLFTDGGLSRSVACRKLAMNYRHDACFGPALLEDLTADMDAHTFNVGLRNSITEILESVDKNRKL